MERAAPLTRPRAWLWSRQYGSGLPTHGARLMEEKAVYPQDEEANEMNRSTSTPTWRHSQDTAQVLTSRCLCPLNTAIRQMGQ